MAVRRKQFRHFLHQSFVFLLASFRLSAEIVAVGGQSDAVPRIRGGVDAPVGRFPYMGSLQDGNGEHRCAAVLIAPEWMLTAAHCIYPSAFDPLLTLPIVVLGDYDLNKKSDDQGIEQVRVEETFIHPSYVHGDIENGFDIAILKLPGPSKKTPIPWARSVIEIGTRVGLTMGWGAEGLNKGSEGTMKMADVPAVTYDLCKDNFWERLKPSMICGNSRFAGTCEGDSGGPLIFPHEPDFDLKEGNPTLDLMVGIVSYGSRDCSSGEKPDVFTNVSSFAQWIKDVISGTYDESGYIQLSSPPPSKPTTNPTSGKSSKYNEVKSKHEGKSIQALEKVMLDATKGNDPLLVEVLIDLGVDISTTYNVEGMTALHFAARDGSLDALKVLIEKGANVDVEGEDGWTPLHDASYQGELDVVRELIKGGANIEDKEEYGETPLHKASQNAKVDVIKELLREGANIDAQGTDGWTPLHDASSKGHVDVVKVLLENGADKAVKDEKGRTPKDVIGKSDESNLSTKDRAKLESLLE